MPANDALDLNTSGLLSDATLLALQLQHQPFTSQLQSSDAQHEDDTQAIGEPFNDTITEELLADVKQALITGDDLLLILGEQGAGKSTLLKQLSANSGLRIQCFAVSGSERFSTLNLFAGMLEAFKRKPPEKLKDILDELVPCLQSLVARNTLSVVVLDDAHNVSKSELTQLLNGMLYMNGQDETLMRVALSANGEFEDSIAELLPEGADLPYSSLTIEGLSTQRATDYLEYRLALVGFNQEFPFTERDMESLVEHSAGMPAKLHALTADVLNEKHGRLESALPRELVGYEAGGFLQSRKGKLALGAIATALILGGILMFLPSGDRNPLDDTTQSVVVTEQPLNPQTILPTPDETVDAQTDELETPLTIATNETPLIPESAAQDTPTLQSSDNESDDNAGVPDDTNSSTNNEIETDPDSQESVGTENSGSASVTTTSENQASSGNPEPESERLLLPQPGPLPVLETETAELPEAVQDNTQDASEQALAESEAPGVADPPAGDTNLITSAADQETAGAPADTDAEQSSETAQSLAESADAALAGLLEPPSWIVVQEDNQFTVQMTASRDRPSVENFLRSNPLPGPNSIFSFERNGDIWYALVHGIFATQAEAQRTVERFPAEVQRDQPWIRSIGRIKAILR